MANLSSFFPEAGGGGGGGIPMSEEFTASGTFTPSQALIDAGGRIALFIVGAGGGGTDSVYNSSGSTGGEVLMKYITLTSTSSITVTIGAGAAKGNPGGTGGSTIFAASSAGGVDVTALGGQGGTRSTATNMSGRLSSGFGAAGSSAASGSAGSGVFGYGVGGKVQYNGGMGAPPANSGGGGGYNQSGGSGFVRVTWFE